VFVFAIRSNPESLQHQNRSITYEELLGVSAAGLGGGDGINTDDLDGVGAGHVTGSHVAVCIGVEK
jgi:hypothetical protein